MCYEPVWSCTGHKVSGIQHWDGNLAAAKAQILPSSLNLFSLNHRDISVSCKVCTIFLLATAQYCNFPYSATLEGPWVTSPKYKGFSASQSQGVNMVMRYSQRMLTEIQVPSNLTCLWLRRKSQKYRGPSPQGRTELRTQGTPPDHEFCHHSGLTLLHTWHHWLFGDPSPSHILKYLLKSCHGQNWSETYFLKYCSRPDKQNSAAAAGTRMPS